MVQVTGPWATSDKVETSVPKAFELQQCQPCFCSPASLLNRRLPQHWPDFFRQQFRDGGSIILIRIRESLPRRLRSAISCLYLDNLFVSYLFAS
jgi:hypothetical protein